jgi:hypothetical protein
MSGPRKAFERALEHLVKTGEELDHALDAARATLPKDRLSALEGTAKKLLVTVERMGAQIVYLADQYERLATPPRGPAGPGRVLTFRPRRRR